MCDKEASSFKDLFNAQNLLVGFSLFNNVQAFVFSHRLKILLSSNFNICSSRNKISVCSGVRGGGGQVKLSDGDVFFALSE